MDTVCAKRIVVHIMYDHDGTGRLRTFPSLTDYHDFSPIITNVVLARSSLK